MVLIVSTLRTRKFNVLENVVFSSLQGLAHTRNYQQDLRNFNRNLSLSVNICAERKAARNAVVSTDSISECFLKRKQRICNNMQKLLCSYVQTSWRRSAFLSQIIDQTIIQRYVITDKINPWSIFLLEKPEISSVKNFLGFNTSRYYATVSTRATQTLKGQTNQNHIF